ncbi:NAD(P)/FAD-dependent oxidoreductase [Jannaschia sp. 2305UL9-9]|uniref:NAD(P)/FAD-dependent oxidoreductase n=1 Tax=Jannaschia sp. 2305UL9-9 TaxID=3121638 RepID=UPI003527B35E
MARYGTVETLTDVVQAVEGATDAFRVTLAGGHSIDARRLILAHGVRDVLPDLPGVAEAWGRTLLHCPYCHGHEVRNRPLAVLAVHPMAGHQATMLRADWSADVTLLTGSGAEIDLSHIGAGHVAVDARPLTALRSDGDSISATFADGSSATFAAIFTQPRVALNGTPATMLGCALADGPLGQFVRVGPMGQTSVPGVFAAGDCARPGHSVTLALGDGAAAGTGCHQSLLFPEMIQPLETA